MTTAKRRTSKIIPQVVTKQHAISAMERYAVATSQLKQIEAKIELATQRTRETHQERIAECQRLQKEAQEELQVFALEMKQTLFSGQKSLHLRHGSIGFRTGTPRVVKKRSLTWEAALRLFKSRKWTFVRVKEAVDKEQIIAQREDPEVMAELSDMGIEVRQEERFFVAVEDSAAHQIAAGTRFFPSAFFFSFRFTTLPSGGRS